MEKRERHHKRIYDKWIRLKKYVRPCSCRGRVVLNESIIRRRRFKKFYCECETCHYCSKKAMTIKRAIIYWNREHLNMIKESYIE